MFKKFRTPDAFKPPAKEKSISFQYCLFPAGLWSHLYTPWTNMLKSTATSEAMAPSQTIAHQECQVSFNKSLVHKIQYFSAFFLIYIYLFTFLNKAQSDDPMFKYLNTLAILENTFCLQTNDARISLSLFCDDLSGVKVISSILLWVYGTSI